MAVNLGTAVGYLDLDTSKFNNGFKSAWTSMQTFADQSKSATTRIQALGSAMGTAGSTLTKSVTLPIVALGTAVVATAAKFEAKMSEVRAISGATGAQMEKLGALAKKMGADTVFSAADAADALKYMGMAGWTAEQMLAGLPGVMYLAAASGEDLGTTSDIVTDALTAFGLQASDSAHFADVLATAAMRSNTNVGMLGESFKYVAPYAGTLGYSIEDTAVALGIMANQGTKAGTAGTSLARLFINMLNPASDEAAAILDKYGLSLTNSDGSMKDLMTVMRELRTAFGSLDEATAATEMNIVAGQRGFLALSAIVNTTEEDFNSLTASMNNADGAAKEMADIMMDNLSGAIEEMLGSAETAAISFGTLLIPMIKQVSAWIKELIDWLENLTEEEKQTVVNIALIAAAIGPLLLIGSKVIALYTSITTGLTAMHAAMMRRKMDIIEEATAYTANTAAGNLNLAARLKGQAAVVASTAIEKLYTLAKNAATASEVAHTAAETGGVGAKILAAGATVGATLANAAYTIGVGIATVATTIFNAALTALPFVAIIAAVAALVVGIVKLISWLANGSKANQQYKKSIEELNERQEELKTNMESSASAFQNAVPAIQATTAQSTTYLSKIQELQGALSNMTAEERANSSTKRELQVYIDRLNASQDGLNLAYDEETGLLNQSIEAIQGMIAAKEQLAIANAYQERANEIASELVDIDTELYRIAQLRVEIGEDEALSDKERENRLADLAESEQGYLDTREEVNGRLTEITEMQVALEAEAAESNVAAMDMQELALQELADQYGISVDEIKLQMAEQNITAEEWATQQEELTKQVQEAYDSYFEQVTNGFDVMNQKTAISLDEFMANMQANQEATLMWSENMAALMDAGVNAGVIAQLEKLGPAGAEQAAAFVAELTELNGGVDISLGNLNEAAQAKLDELEALMGSGAEAATAATETQFGSAEFIASGATAFDQMAVQIGANTSVEAAAVEVITSVTTSVQNEITAADFSGIGKKITDGLKTGLTTGKPSVTNEAKAVIRDTKTAVVSQETASDFKSTGTKITTDIKSGITSGKMNVTNEAKAVIRDTKTAATTQITASDFKASGTKITTDIKTGVETGSTSVQAALKEVITATKSGGSGQVSASDFSSIGRAIADGVAAGINAGASGVVNAAVSMVQEAARAAKAAAQISSPSKLFKNQIGLMLPEGAALGIEDGIKYVVEAINDMMNAAEGAAEGSVIDIIGEPDMYGIPDKRVYDGASDITPLPATRSEGDTFNFYGTEPLDQVGTERAFRAAQRERAEDML